MNLIYKFEWWCGHPNLIYKFEWWCGHINLSEGTSTGAADLKLKFLI